MFVSYVQNPIGGTKQIGPPLNAIQSILVHYKNIHLELTLRSSDSEYKRALFSTPEVRRHEQKVSLIYVPCRHKYYVRYFVTNGSLFYIHTLFRSILNFSNRWDYVIILASVRYTKIRAHSEFNLARGFFRIVENYNRMEGSERVREIIIQDNIETIMCSFPSRMK